MKRRLSVREGGACKQTGLACNVARFRHCYLFFKGRFSANEFREQIKITKPIFL